MNETAYYRCFIHYSTFIIRYPTPTCVWIYWTESEFFSSFLRSVAINTLKEATSFSQLCPQIFCVIKVCVNTFPTFLESRHNSLYSIGVRCNSFSSKYAQPAEKSTLSFPFIKTEDVVCSPWLADNLLSVTFGVC